MGLRVAMSLVQGHTPSRRMAKQSQIRKQILEAWSKWKGQEVSAHWCPAQATWDTCSGYLQELRRFCWGKAVRCTSQPRIDAHAGIL